MSRIFWDTNLFIYLIEDYGALSNRVAGLRRRMLERQDQLYTSTLTLGEVLVKPTETDRDDLCHRYRQALEEAAVLVPFDRDAALVYGIIRKDRTIKPADAIQLSCASTAAVDLFITNDERLSQKVIPGINFITSLGQAHL
jgi:predicted nucleic acid-binding protein